MASLDFHVDTSDNFDENGIESTIDAEMEYICQPTQILSRWSFKPSTTEVTNNIFITLWVGYMQDIDDSDCDVASGSQWPDTVYGANLYSRSSLPLALSFPPGAAAAGTVVEMEPGEICSGNNVSMQSYPHYEVEKGSWIAFGESPDVGLGAPRLRFTVLDEPGAGTGSYEDPHRVAWQSTYTWNEVRDGTIGIGVTRGPFGNPAKFLTLEPEWYRSEFILSSWTEEVLIDGFESGDTLAWGSTWP